ncbi:DUF4158 domain-containing protein [Nonomuraea turkmeniaca]|uniref:DUF4158 domain-containing protein n=1 Tax=Nonomuraea turkmeniaca TaxID=103838 RepID=UPI001FE7B2BA|nr:DUF4158 domain-containing protein [Nonomuraea turkmeniaca]
MLDEDDLIGNGTLVGDELDQLSGRRGVTKLGFALMLRFYAVHGRFPTGPSEIPDQVAAYVARLVDVPAPELGLYEWDGRTIKAHRADTRKYFGFRECTAAAPAVGDDQQCWEQRGAGKGIRLRGARLRCRRRPRRGRDRRWRAGGPDSPPPRSHR